MGRRNSGKNLVGGRTAAGYHLFVNVKKKKKNRARKTGLDSPVKGGEENGSNWA